MTEATQTISDPDEPQPEIPSLASPEPSQPKLSDTSQRAIDAEQARFDETTSRAMEKVQKDYLAQRVFALAVENAELRAQIEEFQIATN